MHDPPVDGSAEEEIEVAQEQAALAVRRPEGTASTALAVAPAVNAPELVQRLEVIKDAMQTAMQKDVDYGVIPGTDKPALLKPGAEKLAVLFQLDVQIENEKEYGPGDHLTVTSKATVYHAPTGARLGFGEGICSSREKKYARRRADRVCPECQKATVLKSRNEGEGFFCWRRKGGCGKNFAAGDERLTSQAEGEIENPDLPDTWNTIVKMAEKRARVDAVLAVTAASALFTQDVDENAPQQTPAAAGPAYGPEAAHDEVARTHRALAFLFDIGSGPDDELATAALTRWEEGLDGYIPASVSWAVRYAAGLLKRKIDAAKETEAEAQAQVQAAREAERPPPLPDADVIDADVVGDEYG